MTNAPGDRPVPPVLRLWPAGMRVFVSNEAKFLIVDAPNGAAAVAGAPDERQIVRRSELHAD